MLQCQPRPLGQIIQRGAVVSAMPHPRSIMPGGMKKFMEATECRLPVVPEHRGRPAGAIGNHRGNRLRQTRGRPRIPHRHHALPDVHPVDRDENDRPDPGNILLADRVKLLPGLQVGAERDAHRACPQRVGVFRDVDGNHLPAALRGTDLDRRHFNRNRAVRRGKFDDQPCEEFHREPQSGKSPRNPGISAFRRTIGANLRPERLQLRKNWGTAVDPPGEMVPSPAQDMQRTDTVKGKNAVDRLRDRFLQREGPIRVEVGLRGEIEIHIFDIEVRDQ